MNEWCLKTGVSESRKMSEELVNAFTCTGAYALLIMKGIKRVENRSAVPSPLAGRCAVGVSKKFCEREYRALVQWVNVNLGYEISSRLPSWDVARFWPGRLIGTIDYRVQNAADCTPAETMERQMWNEGYGCWWSLARPRLFKTPIPCRGNVGMWRMPQDLVAQVMAAEEEDCDFV